METRVIRMKARRAGFVEVETDRPSKIFTIRRAALDNPLAFQQAMLKEARVRPVGPCWGHGPYPPRTKGQLAARWQHMLDRARKD